MFPDEPNDEERLEQLPGDGQTPFRPAEDTVADPTADLDRQRDEVPFDDTQPATDTNVQPEEAYDVGEAGAAELTPPNAGNSVVGYEPTADQRRTEVQPEKAEGSEGVEDPADTAL